MSAYYSKWYLNTYATTPYFQAHIPPDYQWRSVLQKCRSFQRLPPHLRELSILAKRWQLRKHPPSDDPEWGNMIDDWYDEEGHELDPDNKKLMTDEQIDSQWPDDKELDKFQVKDIPVPDGGFPDPDTWEPEPEPHEPEDEESRPTLDRLLMDIASHGRKAVSEEYGIPEDELPGSPDESDGNNATLAIAPPLSAPALTVTVYMTDRPVGTITQKGVGFFLEPKDSEILRKIVKHPVTIHIGGVERQLHATEDPVLFIRHLVFHYRSHQGLMVSKAEESGAPLSLEE